MTMTCDELDALLPEFMDGSLTATEQEDAASHLATCPQCRLVVSELEGVSSLYRTYGRLRLPEESRSRIAEALGFDAETP